MGTQDPKKGDGRGHRYLSGSLEQLAKELDFLLRTVGSQRHFCRGAAQSDLSFRRSPGWGHAEDGW